MDEAESSSNVQKRLEKSIKYRRSSRSSFIDNLRNLSECDSPAPVVDPVQSELERRRQQVDKYKEEKVKKKKEAALKKKKPFVVGVPHPPLKYVPPPLPPNFIPSTSGRVTRSQSAEVSKPKEANGAKAALHSFASNNASFRPPEIKKTMAKLPKLAPKTKQTEKHNITFEPVLHNNEKETSKQRRSKLVKQAASDLEQNTLLHPPKCLGDCALAPEQIIEEAKNIRPCVTMSQGKDNARKEMKKELDEGLLDEDASNIDRVNHFRRQLALEVKRMTEMCEVWDKIMEQTVLPESVQEAVLFAVGQVRLLMSQKLQLFASLVERCAQPEPGTALVTLADLQGFLDKVFKQVKDVQMRFKKLEELLLCDWVEDQPVPVKKKVVSTTVIVKKAAKPEGGPSRLREMIAAAGKAKIRSPASAPSTEVKKITARKKRSTSFEMLRVSVFGENVESDEYSLSPRTPVPMTQINLFATPGSSILNSRNSESNST